MDTWGTRHHDHIRGAPEGPRATTEGRKSPGLAARTEAPREAAVLGLPPAEARTGAWRSAQEPRYSRCTSRSAEKVEEQLVTSAQGTPAAITAPENRFRPGATSALGDTTAAGARGRRARKARLRRHARPYLLLCPLFRSQRGPGWVSRGVAMGTSSSAASSRVWRPRLPGEGFSPRRRHGPGEGKPRPRRIYLNPGGKWASPNPVQLEPFERARPSRAYPLTLTHLKRRFSDCLQHHGLKNSQVCQPRPLWPASHTS